MILFRLSCTMLLCAILVTPGIGEASTICAATTERRVLDHIFNLEFDQAGVVAQTIESKVELIPSADFYMSLVSWSEFQTNEQAGNRNPHTARLRQAVNKLETQFNESGIVKNELAWSLAAAHTARILLNEKRFIGAYNMGYPAIKRLQRLAYSEDLSDTGRKAARLAVGIYYVYANNLPDGLKWTRFLLGSPGTTDLGKSLIEETLGESSSIATEAARTLLLEFPWSFPGHCDYLEISRQMSEWYPDNPDISLARQGLLLRCGHPDAASFENKRFLTRHDIDSISGFNPTDYSFQFLFGQARIFAETGNVEALLENREEFGKLGVYYKQALANAYDLTGNRVQSSKIYREVAEDGEATEAVRKIARMRGDIPYRETLAIIPDRSVFIPDCK